MFAAPTMFQQLDMNQDGVLSRDEFAAAFNAMTQPAYSSAQPPPMFGGPSSYVRPNQLSFTPPIQFSASTQMPAPTAYEAQPQIYSSAQPPMFTQQPAGFAQPGGAAFAAQPATFTAQPTTYTAAPQTYTAPPMQFAGGEYSAPQLASRPMEFPAMTQQYSLSPPMEYSAPQMTAAPAQYTTAPAQYSAMPFSTQAAQYTASVAPAQYTVAPQSVPQVLEAPGQYLGAGQYTMAPQYSQYSQYTAAPAQTAAPQYMSQLAGGQYMTAGNPASTCANCGNVFMPDAVFCRKCGAKRETDAFAQMDVNGDGVLSREEFVAAMR